jgi:predicted phosphodiesterase
MKNPPTLPERTACIGLMSDNHGQSAVLNRAIGALRERGADVLVHLGDFGDSLHRENLAAIVDTLKSNNVLVVKGNNDYIMEKSLEFGNGRLSGIYAYLHNLPIRIISADLCFAHSLPFDSIRSFYDPIDDGSVERAALLFREMTYRVLFCGHSHIPVLFRWTPHRTVREQIPPDQPLRLCPGERYIIVVGALENGECALYNLDRQVYERLRVG